MTITPVANWPGTVSDPSGLATPLPTTPSLEIPVANTGNTGNWLVAFCGWQSQTGQDVTVAVGDDGHNRWEPLGAPAGTAGGPADLAGASIWAAANPRQAGNVFVSPNGPTLAMATLVVELSGLSPWQILAVIRAAAVNNTTALGALAAGIPPAGVPLNANSTFTASSAPWTGRNNAQVRRRSVWGFQADYSLQITPDGHTGAPGAISEQSIPVTAGLTYSASVTLVCPQGWAGGQAVINWYNSSGGLISTTSSAVSVLPAAQAVFVTVAGAAPVGAVTAGLVAQLTGTPPASVVLFASNPVLGVPSQALLFTMLAADLSTATLSGPGSGWTAFPSVTATNGTDHTADLVIKPAWQVTTAAATATWTSSAACDLAGVLGGVLVTGTAPVAPRQNWPLVQAQMAAGSGAVTPWDQVSWWGMTPRLRAMSSGRGKQYELDTIQAGQGSWTLANNDGALTPDSTVSPYFPWIKVYVPVRLLVTWPPPPAANARTYVINRGFMERWPKVLTGSRYQNTNAVSADVWTLLSTELRTMIRAEILQETGLYAYFPLDDPEGSLSGSNLAPGNNNAIQVVVSKYGPGSATAAFGADASGLAGDGGSCWQQQGVITKNQGYTLYYQDPGLPPIAGGVTVEGWFQVGPGLPAVDEVLMIVKNSKGPCIQVALTAATGVMYVGWFDKVTGAQSSVNIGAIDWQDTTWFHLALEFDQTGWTLYVNAGETAVASGPCNLAASPWWVSFNGQSDRLNVRNFWDGLLAHVAIYAGFIGQTRLLTHYLAMLTGLYGDDTTGQRIDRLLAAGNAAFPRCIPAGIDTAAGAVDVQGQAVGQNVVNISESDNSLLLVDGPGYLFSQDRISGYNLPVSWTFGGVVAVPLNANPYFETTVAPWAGLNGATVAQSSGWSYQGTFSMLITGNGTTANPTAISEQTIPVTPGTELTASSWLFSPQGWTSVLVKINWYDGSGTLLSSSSSASAVLAAAGLAQVPVTGQAPASAATCGIGIEMAGTPSGAVQLFADVAVLTAATSEAPFLADIATDFDPTQVFNDLTLTQLASPAVIGGASTGVTVALTDPASILAYGDQTLQETIYLTDPDVITDFAYWILNQFSEPQTRIAQLTLDPAANPALWPVVLAAETGQVAQVNLRLAGTQLEVTGLFQIMTVGHSTAPGSFTCSLTLVPYLGNILTCDDVTRGVLDGENPLGW